MALGEALIREMRKSDPVPHTATLSQQEQGQLLCPAGGAADSVLVKSLVLQGLFLSSGCSDPGNAKRGDPDQGTVQSDRAQGL